MFGAARNALNSRPCLPSRLRNFSSSPSSQTRRHQYVRFGRWPFSQHNTSLKVVAAITGVGGIYWYTHLEQVPETGRWRFMNTGPKLEEKIGQLARKQSYDEHRDRMLPPNHPLSRHVRRVVSRIVAASNLGIIRGETVTVSPDSDSWDPDTKLATAVRREWDVIVVNDQKTANAEAAPGLIVVYTGILPICKDEQGLAAVLAHEIGHVVARHTAERISSATILLIALVALQTLGLDFNLSDLATQLLFQLPNSRTQELEADTIGLKLMSRACFDPKAAPAMFRRLGEMEARMGTLSVNFLRTHPTSELRVQNLEKQLPDAYGILAGNPECGVVQDSIEEFRRLTLGGHGADGDIWVA